MRYGHQRGGAVARCFAPFHLIQAEGRELRRVPPRLPSGKEAPAERWEIARGRCDPALCRDCRSGSRRSPAEQRSRLGNRPPSANTTSKTIRRALASSSPSIRRAHTAETTPSDEPQDLELKVTRHQWRRTPRARWGCWGAWLRYFERQIIEQSVGTAQRREIAPVVGDRTCQPTRHDEHGAGQTRECPPVADAPVTEIHNADPTMS
jgi:hypothetical protein